MGHRYRSAYVCSCIWTPEVSTECLVQSVSTFIFLFFIFFWDRISHWPQSSRILWDWLGIKILVKCFYQPPGPWDYNHIWRSQLRFLHLHVTLPTNHLHNLSQPFCLTLTCPQFMLYIAKHELWTADRTIILLITIASMSIALITKFRLWSWIHSIWLVLTALDSSLALSPWFHPPKNLSLLLHQKCPCIFSHHPVSFCL